jgi:hypothetical protein
MISYKIFRNRIRYRPSALVSSILMGLLLSTGALLVMGCTPTVRVAADEPITINLNVKIEHEVRVRVEQDLEEVFSEDSGLF